MPSYFDEEEEDTGAATKTADEEEPDEGGETAASIPERAPREPSSVQPPKASAPAGEGPAIIGGEGQQIGGPGTLDPARETAKQQWYERQNRQQQMFRQLPPQAQAQVLYDRLKLSNAEDMRLQRLENSVGVVQADPNLADDEKRQLISDLRTQGEPLKYRKLRAEAMQKESQVQAEQADIQRMAGNKALVDKLNADNIHNRIRPSNNGDGTVSHVYELSKTGEIKLIPTEKDEDAKERKAADRKAADTFHRDLNVAIAGADKKLKQETERFNNQMTLHRNKPNENPEPDPIPSRNDLIRDSMIERGHAGTDPTKEEWHPEMRKQRAEAEKERQRGIALNQQREDMIRRGVIKPDVVQAPAAAAPAAAPPAGQPTIPEGSNLFLETRKGPFAIDTAKPESMSGDQKKALDDIDRLAKDRAGAGVDQEIAEMRRLYVKYGSVQNMPAEAKAAWGNALEQIKFEVK